MRLVNTYPHPDRRVLYELRTARKRYQCDDYPQSSADVIKPGDKYVLCTELPGGESGFADDAGHPVKLRLCVNCARLGTRLIPLHDTEEATS